jgi:hypothetical protein
VLYIVVGIYYTQGLFVLRSLKKIFVIFAGFIYLYYYYLLILVICEMTQLSTTNEDPPQKRKRKKGPLNQNFKKLKEFLFGLVIQLKNWRIRNSNFRIY